MKYVRTNEWFRLRGELRDEKTREPVLIDEPVFGEEAVFLVPETENEVAFFKSDKAYNITQIPYSPTSADPKGDWGWRFDDKTTEKEMRDFAVQVENYMMKALDSFDKLLGSVDGKNAQQAGIFAEKKVKKDTILN